MRRMFGRTFRPCRRAPAPAMGHGPAAGVEGRTPATWRACLVRLLALAALLASPLSPAAAEDVAGLYRRIGSWDVRVDSSVGYGCFILAGYRDGTVLRLGIDNRGSAPGGYMILMNKNWQTIEVGKTYSVTLSFEDASSATWKGSGITMGDGKALVFKFASGSFFDAVAQRRVLRVRYGGRAITELPLPGTAAALAGMFECQKTFDSMHQATTDPFASPVSQ